jgi:hypothetical protein
MIHHNGSPLPPLTCPTCGKPWPLHVCLAPELLLCTAPDAGPCAPFRPALSAALDWLQAAGEAIEQAKHAIEEEALP